MPHPLQKRLISQRSGTGPVRKTWSGYDAPGERLYLQAKEKLERAKTRQEREQRVRAGGVSGLGLGRRGAAGEG